MRKTLYTLNIGNYAPEIRELTYPLLKYHAKKIGAEFFVITERRFPEWPVTYEKLQIYDLAEERGDEWSIFMDSDCLVHPETMDWTNFLPTDTIAHNGIDMAAVRWRYDRYFLRDGRNIGSCNWLAIASDWCRDLWHPLELTPEQAVDNIYPTVDELNTVITPDHLVDDYALSRNIARYGLKAKTVIELQESVIPGANFYWHIYTETIGQKLNGYFSPHPETGELVQRPGMRQMIKDWKLERFYK